MGVFALDNTREVHLVPFIHVAGLILHACGKVEVAPVFTAVNIYRVDEHAAGVETFDITVHRENRIFIYTEIERTHRHLRWCENIVDKV